MHVKNIKAIESCRLLRTTHFDFDKKTELNFSKASLKIGDRFNIKTPDYLIVWIHN